MLRALVSTRGDQTVIAGDGRKGLELFVNHDIDLVFCDIVMPDMGGLEFLERARASDPEVPVVLMTAYADKNKLTRAVQLNAFDFLEKPFELAKLDVAIERALWQRQILLQRKRTRRFAARVEDLVRRLNATRELSVLYRLLEHDVHDALDVTQFAVFARVGDSLERRAGHGVESWTIDEWSDPVFQCLEHGRVREFAHARDAFGVPMDEVGVGVCLPLRVELQRWGALVLFRADGSFDDIDRRNFRLVSDHLASSIAVRERSAELERALRALEEAQGRLLRTEKLASVTKLVAGLAHEIKNPLTSMQFAVVNARDELRELEPDAERTAGVTRFLDLFASDVDRLRERVDRFMELARPDAAAREHVDVGALIERVLKSVGSRALAQEVDLVADLDHGIPKLELDPEGLEAAVVNLVVNALEALAGPGRVRLELTADEHCILIAVDDNGPGLTVEAKERMFDIFFTTKASGAGLGLSQVHVFIETQGGKVTWNSSSHGTRFELRIPRMISHRLL